MDVGTWTKTPYPTTVAYGREHVKFVAVDVFVCVVQYMSLEGVHSDILAQFAGYEEAL
jgi:hypothetical protein